MTVKMLKNKIENQTIEQLPKGGRKSQSTDSSINDSKVIDILKQNVKDKNSQIEELTKRNKLLTYQLEEVNRLSKADGGSDKARTSGKFQEQKEGMVKKMNELSVLLMNQ